MCISQEKTRSVWTEKEVREHSQTVPLLLSRFFTRLLFFSFVFFSGCIPCARRVYCAAPVQLSPGSWARAASAQFPSWKSHFSAHTRRAFHREASYNELATHSTLLSHSALFARRMSFVSKTHLCLQCADITISLFLYHSL